MTLEKFPHLFKSYTFCKPRFKSHLLHEAPLDRSNPYFWYSDAYTVPDPALSTWRGQFCIVGFMLDLDAMSLNPWIFESYTGVHVFASHTPYLSPHIQVSPRLQSNLLWVCWFFGGWWSQIESPGGRCYVSPPFSQCPARSLSHCGQIIVGSVGLLWASSSPLW